MFKTNKLTIQKNIPLAPLTTFKIGGPARFFVIVTTKDDLLAALNWAKEKKLPVLILGGGSNLLISDAGWPGLVVRVALGGWHFENLPKNLILNTKYLILVGAGVLMSVLAKETVQRGLTGLEWAGNLPGTVGGAVRGNAGAFRFEIGQAIKSVEVLRNGEVLRLNQIECSFDYRNSLFKNKFKDDIILSVELELTVGDPAESCKKLEEFATRRQKAYSPLPSAGCVFKNFVVTNISELKANLYESLPADFKKYKKIPAGWLVEQVGMKGARVGGAQVSPQHANFIVNLGNATAQDVLTLIAKIKEKVYNKFQIELAEEIQII